MLDIKIGPTSFRPSCQLEGVHTRNKDLSLFHGCGLNNILMLSFWGPSSGISYILLCLSTVTHALLKDQIYKTKKIQCSYNSVMAVLKESCGNGPTFNNTFYVQMLYRTLSSLNSLWLAEELVRTCMNVFPT